MKPRWVATSSVEPGHQNLVYRRQRRTLKVHFVL